MFATIRTFAELQKVTEAYQLVSVHGIIEEVKYVFVLHLCCSSIGYCCSLHDLLIFI